jgi:hypothetical protein
LRQRRFQGLDHGDFEPQLPRGRCNLRTDEARTDDGNPRIGLERGPDRQRVVQGSQRMDAVDLRLIVKLAHVATRRDHQPIEGNHVAAFEPHLTRVGVERDGALTQHEIDIQVVVAPSTKCESVLLPLAAEHLLGERRPVVRQVLFVANQDEMPFERGAPDELRGTQPGKGSADDGNPIHLTHRSKGSSF